MCMRHQHVRTENIANKQLRLPVQPLPRRNQTQLLPFLLKTFHNHRLNLQEKKQATANPGQSSVFIANVIVFWQDCSKNKDKTVKKKESNVKVVLKRLPSSLKETKFSYLCDKKNDLMQNCSSCTSSYHKTCLAPEVKLTPD